MKTLVTVFLLLAVTIPMAAVDDGQVMYAGGTASNLTSGLIGRLDTTSETSLTFENSGNKLMIPYGSIESFEYSKEVTHHLGVLAGVGVALLKQRERRHFFRISYVSGNNTKQVAVFEVPKQMPRTLQAVLEARAPLATRVCSPCAGRHEAVGHSR